MIAHEKNADKRKFSNTNCQPMVCILVDNMPKVRYIFGMRVIVLVALLLAVYSDNSFPDQAHKLERIVVTPSRLGANLAGDSRSIAVLDEAALTNSAYADIPDIIGNIGGIDIRRRSPQGVQADINIRGANFEENSVLIDGIKLNDPQTAHHNMDLPITLMDVDRIEILKGPASSIYGPNSFGGVINIITKRPEGRKVIVNSEGGSNDYFREAISVSCPVLTANNRFSIEESRSGGYRPETDFNIFSLSNATALDTLVGKYDFLFGYTKKDFGADSFYSNLYTNEEEHTDTRFFKIDGQMESKNLKITPRLFLRRHKDKFALDRNRPGWQTNYHTTYTYGGELNFIFENDFLDTSYGYELAQDTIDSTSLQTHSRTRDGMHFEVSPKLSDKLYLNALFRSDYFSGFGWEHSPSINASYRLFEDLILRALIGRAYRIPTFTDLYYNDPANKGSAALRPEYCWSYEAGADYRIALFSASATFFHRDSYDTIDWTRASSKDPWQASNIGTTGTNGLELSFKFDKIFFNYTVLDIYAKHDYLSKYALDYLKQHISAGAELEFLGFRNHWVLNYKKRIGDSGYIVVDTRISKDIVKVKGVSFEAFLDLSNLFNVDYSEQSDIPMPAREVRAGGRLEF